jgi:hypothetical protein
MVNPLYKTTVRELEAVLPPRVVSQSLHEGLAALGKTAETSPTATRRASSATGAAAADAHPRRGAGGGGAARNSGTALRRAGADPQPRRAGAGAGAFAGGAKALNIYFEWSETQKFRAQLSLIEAEHAAGRDAGELIAAAQAQLGALQQNWATSSRCRRAS